MLLDPNMVADKFHVTQLVNQDLNAARNDVIKANGRNQDAAEKERVLAALKQSKYALLKAEFKTCRLAGVHRMRREHAED